MDSGRWYSSANRTQERPGPSRSVCTMVQSINIWNYLVNSLLFLGGSSACYGTIPLSDLARIPGAKQVALALQASPQHIDNTLANNRQIYQTPAQSYRSNMFY
ncbi:hypothetical protein C8J56DRAFT_886757 [Mycena floridula]|nr:hypothetical protein C8J56DRAFT_886757 [Mycena floridula]